MAERVFIDVGAGDGILEVEEVSLRGELLRAAAIPWAEFVEDGSICRPDSIGLRPVSPNPGSQPLRYLLGSRAFLRRGKGEKVRVVPLQAGVQVGS